MSSPLLTLLGDVSRVEIRGRTLGVYRVFGDIGGTVGPIFGINLAATWGFRAMYLSVATMMLVTLGLIVSLYLTEVGTISEEA